MRQFHEHQQNAYDSSARLALLLGAAIVGTILASGIAITYLVAVAYQLCGLPPAEHVTALLVTCGTVCLVCSLIVATGTTVKLFQLRAGGKVIAEDLGGRLVDEPSNLNERQLLNVVEEMSIASGIPVPPVYLLDGDDSINAFAAGFDPRMAVIGATRGAIKHLSRDQLQGVIAHEFSHILNGDMRLNLKMVGWLHGVLSITIVAQVMIHTGWELLRKYSEHDSRDLPIHALILIVVGCALWPVGLIGTFMSLLAKSATNRQREHLADAFAVQFTRHPDGLAQAFKRLAGHAGGSRVSSPQAIEASHLFFVEGCGSLASLLASHPPLVDRILRLDPQWDGVPMFPEEHELHRYRGAFEGALGLVSQLQPTDATAEEPGQWLDDRVREVPDMIATMEFIESVLESLPDALIKITQTDGGTSLLLYGLWLANARDEASGYALLDEAQVHRLKPLVPFLQEMEPAQLVLLLDTALKELQQTNGSERAELRRTCQRYIELTETGNLFHWMWAGVVSQSLTLAEKPKARFGRLKQVEGACEVVLSQVCHASGKSAVAGFAFQRGLANLGLENIRLLDPAEFTWKKFQLAVGLVSQLAPEPRRRMLLACSSALSSDQDVSPDEAYIIRGICQRLGYDVPCVLPGQPIKPGA